MKKRIKPSWKSLTLGEKIGVIICYSLEIILGIASVISIAGLMYLQCPIVW